jgi:hypothetical protein
MKVQPLYGADKGAGSVVWPSVIEVEIFRRSLEERGVIREISFSYVIPKWPMGNGATCSIAHFSPYKRIETEEELLEKLSEELEKYRKRSGIGNARFEFVRQGEIRYQEITTNKNLSEDETTKITKGLEEKLGS